MEYTPDNWVIIKCEHHDGTAYRVLCGWSGGWTTGDSWRLNSGVAKMEEEEHHYLFYSKSGKCYRCHKDGYCLRMNVMGIYNQLMELENTELMPEETDWSTFDWSK